MKAQTYFRKMCRENFKTKLIGVFLLLLTGPIHEVFAQLQPWKDALSENFVREENTVTPVRFRLVELDLPFLKTILRKAPLEYSANAEAEKLMIEFPMPDGRNVLFSVMESPILERPEKYPYIKTYIATSTDATMRFDLTPSGFHAMISSSEYGTAYIDPCSSKGGNQYYSYYRKELPASPVLSRCLNDEQMNRHDYIRTNRKNKKSSEKEPHQNQERSSGTQLRTYRLAMTADTSYCNYFGNTDSAIMSNIVIAINRVNQVYESEVDIRFIIIGNNDQLFLDPPLGLGAPTTASLLRNQVITDSIIGTANYDIGHYFTISTGGLAYHGVTCSPGWKAQGGTGRPIPVGDAFFVDYVCHEMGHQMNAHHTYNQISGNCVIGQWISATAFEPGSGSTIMSYAGICSAANLQLNSDPHFHTGSFDEIITYTQTDSGNTCASVIATGNTPPALISGIDYSIPTETPFFLSGTGSDANGDAITYCWEEIDTGPNGVWNMPSGNAPAFRSFLPTADSVRIFPKIEALVRDTTYIGEILPSYARILNFRLTVRDNRAGGSGVTYNDAPKLVSLVTGGPFHVMVPNVSMNWKAESIDTVKWNPGISIVAPVSCALVDIYLSVDSGYTYPYLLKSHTPNDGIEAVLVPDTLTDKARIKVQSVGNIFFDISNKNFSIINNPIAVSAIVTPVSCFGLGNGTIDQTISGAFPPVTHHWSNGAISEDIGGLAPGFYTDTIQDGFDEKHIISYYITEPSLLMTTCTSTAATCSYLADGNCSSITSGGSGPYSYLWSNGDTTAIADALMASTYSVIVTDINGCTVSCSTTVSAPPPIVATILGIDPIPCAGGHGCVMVSASGGIPPYSNTGTLCGLFAGHHDIIVTDVSGCASLPVGVDLVEPSMLSLVLTQLAPIYCHGNTTCINITPTGGTPPYVPYPFPVTLCGVPAGVHFYNIVDSKGCIGVSSISIAEPPELIAACGGQDVVCHGDSNGVAFVLSSGGTPAYTYAWSEGSTSPGISSLAPGIYNVTVYDVFGCYSNCSYTVDEPDALVLNCTGSDLLCSDDDDGTAFVLATGGVTPLVYDWENGNTTPGISGLVKGNYTVVVSDANNCIDSCTAIITAPDTLIAMCTVTADESCPGDANGEIVVTATGGTAPYGGTGTFNNLVPGPYTYMVTDNNSCQASCTSIISTLFSVSVAPTSVTSDAIANTACSGNSVTLTVHGGSLGSGASWQWYKSGCGSGLPIGSGNSISVLPVSAGAHHYYVRAEGVCDTTSCASIVITAVSSITPFLISGIDSICTTSTLLIGYSVLPSTTGTTYLWTAPVGAVITGGQGTGLISVNYTSIAIANGINGPLCVTATGACYDTLSSCISLNINSVIPVTPPSISGPSKLCPGDIATYSIAPVFRTNQYKWNLPGGMTFLSNEHANIISAAAGPSYTGGTLYVTATNSCGQSPTRAKTLLFNLPLQPKPITGITAGLCGISGAVFSTVGASGATSYSWTVPPALTIIGGAGTATITVDALPSFTTGTITVAGMNACGIGTSRTLNSIGAPPKPSVVSGDITICPGQSGELYAVATVPSTSTYEWVVPGGVAIVGGQGTKFLTVNYSTTPATSQVISVRGINSCGTGAWRSLSGISIDSAYCGAKMNGFIAANTLLPMEIYPNPASNHFIIQFISTERNNYLLKISDVSGRTLFTHSAYSKEGDNKLEFFNDFLTTGWYMVELHTQRSAQIGKLLIE
ncbi:MAG: T9SS type A sorting domain-containing protein [Bacteroidetes bacterium]|nr:T9SS type A sorting domain-containing protein [Bacteroidota bacterium]